MEAQLRQIQDLFASKYSVENEKGPKMINKNELICPTMRSLVTLSLVALFPITTLLAVCGCAGYFSVAKLAGPSREKTSINYARLVGRDIDTFNKWIRSRFSDRDEAILLFCLVLSVYSSFPWNLLSKLPLVGLIAKPMPLFMCLAGQALALILGCEIFITNMAAHLRTGSGDQSQDAQSEKSNIHGPLHSGVSASKGGADRRGKSDSAPHHDRRTSRNSAVEDILDDSMYGKTFSAPSTGRTSAAPSAPRTPPPAPPPTAVSESEVSPTPPTDFGSRLEPVPED
jgi:hypothetical protein